MSWTKFAPLPLLACHTATAPAVVTDGVIDVGGGTSLHFHCVGAGAPIVVLDAGLGNDSRVWSGVLPEIGKFTRACAYDRAGMGYSSRPAPRPHTNRLMARELHALLQRAGLAAPYVLVGHSLGGVNVRLFASEHLDEVFGLVLVDAVNDEQPSRYWSLLPEADMAEFRAGIAKLPEGLDYDTYVAGIADMHASSRSVGDRPLVVLTRGKEDAPPGTSPGQVARQLQAWHDMQSELTHLSTNAVQVVAENSHHFIQWDAPKLVIASIRQVVEASRTHSRIDGSMLAPLADGNAP